MTASDMNCPLIGELGLHSCDCATFSANTYGFDAGENNIYDAVKALAFDNCFESGSGHHLVPKRAGINRPRLDRMAADYLSAEDTQLNACYS